MCLGYINSNKTTKIAQTRNLQRHSITKSLTAYKKDKNAETKCFFLFKINNFILVVLKDI